MTYGVASGTLRQWIGAATAPTATSRSTCSTSSARVQENENMDEWWTDIQAAVPRVKIDNYQTASTSVGHDGPPLHVNVGGRNRNTTAGCIGTRRDHACHLRN